MKGLIEYEVIQDGEAMLRRARVLKIEFHPKLGPLFTAITPFGHTIRLTKREIKRYMKKERRPWINSNY